MPNTPCPKRITASRGRVPLTHAATPTSPPEADAVPPPRQRPAWADLLSARETEVLHCLARGLSNVEIAAELFISQTTVKTHVANLLAKLRARDRVQLVVQAFRSGFVSMGPSASAGSGTD